MITSAVYSSHSPLMYHNRARPDFENTWNEALEKAIRFPAKSKPEFLT